MPEPSSLHVRPLNLRSILIVQARMSSTRLPGKVLKNVLAKPLLAYQIERLRQVTLADEIVIATTSQDIDLPIVDCCLREKIPCFRGSAEDVLDRYYQAACLFKANLIIRISADCPLIDPKIVDELIGFYLRTFPAYEYVSNTLERTYPRGMDVEVFSFKALEKAFQSAVLLEEREHVTPYIYRNKELFSLANVKYGTNESQYRLTVDTQEDFQLIETILTEIYPKIPQFTMQDILKLLKEHPEWRLMNAHIRQKS